MNVAKFDGRLLHYEIGDWQTEQLGLVEVSSRVHVLAFMVDAIKPEHFLPVGAVNQEEFLGVRPEFLMCMRAVVSKICLTTDRPEDSTRFWSITFNLEEHASLSWNELFHHVGEGKLVKRSAPFNPLFHFGNFFGQADFPVGLGPDKEMPE